VGLEFGWKDMQANGAGLHYTRDLGKRPRVILHVLQHYCQRKTKSNVASGKGNETRLRRRSPARSDSMRDANHRNQNAFITANAPTFLQPCSLRHSRNPARVRPGGKRMAQLAAEYFRWVPDVGRFSSLVICILLSFGESSERALPLAS